MENENKIGSIVSISIVAVSVMLLVIFGIYGSKRATDIKPENNSINEVGDSASSSLKAEASGDINNINNKKEMNNDYSQYAGVKELIVKDSVVGDGKEAVSGNTVTVNYTGRFIDGNVFDSSIPRGEPFTFALGAGQVIKGWDQGVAGMKVGGKRTLIIPASLGYGSRDVGPIPAGSVLIFDVELLGVK